MNKVNIDEIEEERWQSPRGKYAALFTGISLALGRDENSMDLAKRHPFDLEITRIPPGKINFPCGAHSAQWEMYLVISGTGIVRDQGGSTGIEPGDAFIFPPNQAHQIINSGRDDLVYYVIADNPVGDAAYYPDSGKWKVNRTSAADRPVIKGDETDYLAGEE